MKYISFFSGALGLDLGLEKGGFSPLLFCEFDKHCQGTIKNNRPEIPLLHDINNISVSDILNTIGLSKNDPIDLVVGGPPCQAFSTAGARRSFEDDRGNVFLHFLKLATDLSPKYIVIENVRGLLSAIYHPSLENELYKNIENNKGSALRFVISFLEKKGYSVSFNLYNSANYGSPQIRERLIIIANKSSIKVPYLMPTHSDDPQYNLPKWRTLRSVISDLSNNDNKLCAKFPDKRLKYYSLLSEGQNWKNLPSELQEEAIGKAFHLGGGKTGFYRRLAWDKPSPTLLTSPTMPATDLAHPVENRPLSIAEYKRIQEFHFNWVLSVNITQVYKQIGNAVPLSIGVAIAKALRNFDNGLIIHPPKNFRFSRYRNTSDKDFNL